MSAPDSIVSARGVKRSYRMGDEVVWALAGVDLDIFRGEYVSIMGPSGSGKSTLFNMIGGLDRPTEGQLLIRKDSTLAGADAATLAHELALQIAASAPLYITEEEIPEAVLEHAHVQLRDGVVGETKLLAQALAQGRVDPLEGGEVHLLAGASARDLQVEVAAEDAARRDDDHRPPAAPPSPDRASE